MLNVGKIEEGFVLDHIKAGQSLSIYHHLQLDTRDCTVAMIMNAKSDKMGKKDILKVEYGLSVLITHPNGVQTRYGHLSEISVSAGQTVEQGQRIGFSGSTGNSTGPHLHFEVIVNGQVVDPLTYVSEY